MKQEIRQRGSIDDKDKKIIEQLRENSRQSSKEIAKKTGIRPSTVHARIQSLKGNGYIKKFTVITDDEKVQRGLTAFIFLTSKKELPASFFQNQNIVQAYGITGEFDLLLKTKFKDVSE